MVKTFFSESGHVAYQINGDEAYNNVLAKILPIHTVTHLIPVDGFKRSKLLIFLKVVLFKFTLKAPRKNASENVIC